MTTYTTDTCTAPPVKFHFKNNIEYISLYLNDICFGYLDDDGKIVLKSLSYDSVAQLNKYGIPTDAARRIIVKLD